MGGWPIKFATLALYSLLCLTRSEARDQMSWPGIPVPSASCRWTEKDVSFGPLSDFARKVESCGPIHVTSQTSAQMPIPAHSRAGLSLDGMCADFTRQAALLELQAKSPEWNCPAGCTRSAHLDFRVLAKDRASHYACSYDLRWGCTPIGVSQTTVSDSCGVEPVTSYVLWGESERELLDGAEKSAAQKGEVLRDRITPFCGSQWLQIREAGVKGYTLRLSSQPARVRCPEGCRLKRILPDHLTGNDNNDLQPWRRCRQILTREGSDLWIRARFEVAFTDRCERAP